MSVQDFKDVMSRKMAKLTIIGFKDADKPPKFDLDILKTELSKALDKDSNVFSVMYNPSSYDRKLSLKTVAKYDSNTGLEIKEEQKGPSPSVVSFSFTIDATGASPSTGVIGSIKNIKSKLKGVDDEIDHLVNVAYKTNKETHLANHLWVIWGTTFYSGITDSIGIQYTLFDRIGRPIRAKITFSFTLSDPFERNRIQLQLQSPDVSKTRTVKAGDTLLLLAKEMYDDESLYLEVARINKLKNYRRLTPGQVLVFPPINQQED
jgi:nucleoid-associated protein YgaU